jgi:ADP-ribose pyrophosphatase YjhB (NUDIX family)
MAHQDWSGAGLLLAWQGVSGWEVLLAERNEPPYLGYWSVPGGGSHFSDAAPFDTALRELGEELFQGIALQPLMRPFLGGDSASSLAKCQSHTTPAGRPWRTFMLPLAKKIPLEALAINFAEVCQARWFTIPGLPGLIHPCVPESLDHFQLR